VGWGAVLAVALIPLLLSEITAYNAGLVLIFVVVALGLHLLVNWAGQLSLAQAGMFGVPALSVAALSEAHGLSPLYLLPIGIALGAATGALIALPALKAHGLHIALLTLTADIAINRFVLQQGWLIGKSGARHGAVPSLGPLRFATTKGLYVPLLALTILTIAFFWMLMHSRFGRAWLWIGANPDAASAFGVPVVAYKIAAYAAAGAFAGLSVQPSAESWPLASRPALAVWLVFMSVLWIPFGAYINRKYVHTLVGGDQPFGAGEAANGS